MTQPCHKDTAQTNNAVTENTNGGEGEKKIGETMQEGREQCEGENPIRTRASQHTPLPSFNGTTTHTDGGHRHTDGGHRHSTGRPATRPPFTHHATHHPLCRPTIHDSPTLHHDEGGADRGYPTTQQHRHTLTTHTPHTWRGTVHDTHCSTRQHCTGMSRAQATSLHWAGQQQHTPPPFHTPRRMDTIHSSTHHSHSFTFTHR